MSVEAPEINNIVSKLTYHTSRIQSDNRRNEIAIINGRRHMTPEIIERFSTSYSGVGSSIASEH